MSSNSKKQILVLPEILTEEYLQSKEGEYFPLSAYKHVIKSDADVYGVDENGEKKLLLKFRKNLIPLDVCQIALVNLKKAAMRKHDNRGAAGGVLDLKKLPKYVKGFVKPGKFRTVGYYNADGNPINSSLGNMTQSNIIGFYDKADRNLYKGPKCRLCAFNSKEVEKWTESLPLIQYADACYNVLAPNFHKKQWDRAHTTEFVIPNTSFSTATINYNWRTALHKDDGDFRAMGNLMVLEEEGKKYEGGYTGFPGYGVCVDVRMTDFLLMDVHQWHCNTPITGQKNKDGTDNFTRLSVVCYLREGMLKCSGISLAESIEASNQNLLKKEARQLKEDGYIEDYDEHANSNLYNKK